MLAFSDAGSDAETKAEEELKPAAAKSKKDRKKKKEQVRPVVSLFAFHDDDDDCLGHTIVWSNITILGIEHNLPSQHQQELIQ